MWSPNCPAAAPMGPEMKGKEELFGPAPALAVAQQIGADDAQQMICEARHFT